MAFRILNDEELLLLDDSQRKQYEHDMDIYQKRVNFVEQLEAHSNANIRPFEPKLESVNVIGEIETKSFAKPEYVLTVCETVKKPELQLSPFVMEELIKPVLPVLSKRASVNVDYIKNIEHTQPELPSIIKTVAPSIRFEKKEKKRHDLPAVAKSEVPIKSYKRLEKNQPKLPSVVKLSMQSDFLFNPLGIDSLIIKESMPKVDKPSIELHIFATPEIDEHRLPNVPVNFVKVRHYNKPELTDANLPSVAKPKINVNPFKKVKPIQTNLPELLDISPAKAVFKKPELSTAELPAVVKPSVNACSFERTELTKPNLPKTSNVSIQLKDFVRPEHSVPVLPPVTKVHSGTKSFERPEYKNPILPVVAKTHFAEMTYKPVEITKPNIVAAESPNISIKSFAKIERQHVTGLPNKTVFTIPDAYEKLKDLFQANEESGVWEGNGS